MTRARSTYKVDREGLKRALADLAKSDALDAADTAAGRPPDYSWQDRLPELPPLPKAEDETVVVHYPPKRTRKQ